MVKLNGADSADLAWELAADMTAEAAYLDELKSLDKIDQDSLDRSSDDAESKEFWDLAYSRQIAFIESEPLIDVISDLPLEL